MDLSEHWALLCALAAAGLAVFAWVAELRRMRRKDIDRVGFMPWAGLFFLALFAAVIFLRAALKMG